MARLTGPPLLMVPLIILAMAQQPIIPAVTPTAATPVLDISVHALVVVTVFNGFCPSHLQFSWEPPAQLKWLVE